MKSIISLQKRKPAFPLYCLSGKRSRAGSLKTLGDVNFLIWYRKKAEEFIWLHWSYWCWQTLSIIYSYHSLLVFFAQNHSRSGCSSLKFLQHTMFSTDCKPPPPDIISRCFGVMHSAGILVFDPIYFLVVRVYSSKS